MIEAATHSERPAPSERMPLSPADVVRVARPGLIASHLWAYLLPILHGSFGLGGVLLATGFSIGRYRHSSTTYSTFIVLDWIWLGVLL